MLFIYVFVSGLSGEVLVLGLNGCELRESSEYLHTDVEWVSEGTR